MNAPTREEKRDRDPRRRHVLLLGGGHTHSLILQAFAKSPPSHTSITLVSDEPVAAYSGMLPGHVAGFYRREEIHIDLAALCRRAGAHFVRAAADGIDPAAKTVHCEGSVIAGPADILSINIGAVPSTAGVSGSEEHAIPSKPAPRLLDGWDRLCAAADGAATPPRAVIVGGGAGGVELALAMRGRLGNGVRLAIVHRGPEILAGHPPRARTLLSRLLVDRGIELHRGRAVTSVDSSSVELDGGGRVPADFIFWVTRPSPPRWLQHSGLAPGPHGFVRVNSTLECIAHPGVFAAGDVASIEGEALPKAGVFAVRMAKPLEANLRAVIEEGLPIPYHPQKRFLSLIGTGDGCAMAIRGRWVHRSRLIWWLKDRIDRGFMQRFNS